jgi:hypothetical protein
MATGLCDILHKGNVFHPREVMEAVENWDKFPHQQQISKEDWQRGMMGRWHRCVETANLIDAIKAGYCSVQSPGAPPSSDARH